jgi:hypothetical protein
MRSSGAIAFVRAMDVASSDETPPGWRGYSALTTALIAV